MTNLRVVESQPCLQTRIPTTADVLRILAVDAVQKANSGHPGMPMGMAEIADVLWRRHLRHNPANPRWPDRDRFVVSNGHGSMLLYALLHLTGYDLPIEELKRFRQLHSKTPGHPEFGVTPGVETTTGPLGQGFANAVGMALGEKRLATEFNRPGFQIVDHRTYVFLGDGCLMEGISHEAAALAGVLGLHKLICIYDDNGISIDGKVEGWFTDDTPKRFEAYGWRVIPNVDGHDPEAINAALHHARDAQGRPTLICCKTVIGMGSPNKAGSHDVHGAALGEKEVAATREALGWRNAPFEIPAWAHAEWDGRAKGHATETAWRVLFSAYAARHPALAVEFHRRVGGELPADWSGRVENLLAQTATRAESIATRKASQNAIEALAGLLPELLGGSADLTGSNLTAWPGSVTVEPTGPGNYIHYGVREFGMAAAINGIALHGGLIPFGGTFVMFSDYARNALRMAALMRVRSIFVLTHDSIGLGEDGPTHQPVEHAATLRYVPGLDVWRPCDTLETAVAWTAAIERRTGPTCLLLSRQSLPFQKHASDAAAQIRRGGYVLAESGGMPQVVLIATGSEVAIAMQARSALETEGIPVRVVSMPSTTVFDRQTREYRSSVLPDGIPRVAIEAGITDFWRKYVGLDGVVLGIDSFGESAPASDLFRHFGLTVENAVAAVKNLLGSDAAPAATERVMEAASIS